MGGVQAEHAPEATGRASLMGSWGTAGRARSARTHVATAKGARGARTELQCTAT